MRELSEETGYEVTKILKVSPALVYEPGLSNSNMKMVLAEVCCSRPVHATNYVALTRLNFDCRWIWPRSRIKIPRRIWRAANGV